MPRRVLYKFVLLLNLVLPGREGYSQNFVVNGSFEDYTSCPGGGDIRNAVPWTNGGNGPPGNTVRDLQYFNSCSSP